jgi:hypothetical protein
MRTKLSTVEDLHNLSYHLGDGQLQIRCNECGEWWVSLQWDDKRTSVGYKPTLTEAVIDAAASAAMADQEFTWKLMEDNDAYKEKLQKVEAQLDGALKQLGVR